MHAPYVLIRHLIEDHLIIPDSLLLTPMIESDSCVGMSRRALIDILYIALPLPLLYLLCLLLRPMLSEMKQ